MIHFHFSASLVLEPAYGEIESIGFNNPDPQGINITSYNHSIVSLHIMYAYICIYINCTRLLLVWEVNQTTMQSSATFPTIGIQQMAILIQET